jgi:hypothetical protein
VLSTYINFFRDHALKIADNIKQIIHF